MSIDTLVHHEKPLAYPGYYKENIWEIKKRVVSVLGGDKEQIGKKMKRILFDNFNVSPELVSDEEVKDLYILFSYLLPRVIHGQVQFRGLNKPGRNPKIPNIGNNSLVWHDLSHSIARYMVDPTNQANDPGRFTPTPFNHQYRGYPEYYDALVEELYATIWMRSGVGKRGSLLPLRLMEKNQTIDSGTALYKT